MANILSQDEVDSLLSGIGEGTVETETDIPENEEDQRLYDFSKESGPIHLRMPALGIINERLITFLNTSLPTLTGSPADINITDIDSVKYGEFCRSLPLPSSLNIFTMEPLRGFALIALEGPLVFAFVDTFFGGKCTGHVKLEGKSFTAIEEKIINRIVTIILEDMQKAWSNVHEVKMVYTRSEIDPQFAGIATPNEMIIVTKFSVDIENFTGTMSICLPYSNIEPIKNDLQKSFQSRELETDKTWKDYITKRIRNLNITLSCTFGTAKLTSKELMDMKIGDVIPLDKKKSEPNILNLEGIPKFLGAAGHVGNRYAIQIEERVKEGVNYG